MKFAYGFRNITDGADLHFLKFNNNFPCGDMIAKLVYIETSVDENMKGMREVDKRFVFLLLLVKVMHRFHEKNASTIVGAARV
jgi:hypothetical protein